MTVDELDPDTVFTRSVVHAAREPVVRAARKDAGVWSPSRAVRVAMAFVRTRLRPRVSIHDQDVCLVPTSVEARN